MPVYQYACPDCGYTFEKQQKFTDPPAKRCPKCGKRRVYRLINQVAVTFKGSGWYITDSRADRTKQAEKANGEAKASTKAEATAGETASKSAEKASQD